MGGGGGEMLPSLFIQVVLILLVSIRKISLFAFTC